MFELEFTVHESETDMARSVLTLPYSSNGEVVGATLNGSKVGDGAGTHLECCNFSGCPKFLTAVGKIKAGVNVLRVTVRSSEAQLGFLAMGGVHPKDAARMEEEIVQLHAPQRVPLPPSPSHPPPLGISPS